MNFHLNQVQRQHNIEEIKTQNLIIRISQQRWATFTVKFTLWILNIAWSNLNFIYAWLTVKQNAKGFCAAYQAPSSNWSAQF